jgi:hypothetical protein
MWALKVQPCLDVVCSVADAKVLSKALDSEQNQSPIWTCRGDMQSCEQGGLTGVFDIMLGKRQDLEWTDKVESINTLMEGKEDFDHRDRVASGFHDCDGTIGLLAFNSVLGI